jgi:hypothetical protein
MGIAPSLRAIKAGKDRSRRIQGAISHMSVIPGRGVASNPESIIAIGSIPGRRRMVGALALEAIHVVPAHAGTHTPRLRLWHGGRRLLLQQTTVVMGPRFRGEDDAWWGALVLISRRGISRFKQPRKPRLRDLAARCARGVQEASALKDRGRRECRVPNAPAASCVMRTNTRA